MFVATVVSSLLQISFLAHKLPPDLAGLWALAMTIAHYLAHFNFGLGPTIIRELSRICQGRATLDEPQLRLARDTFATAMLMTTAFCAVAALAGYLLGNWLFVEHAPASFKDSAPASWALFLLGAVMNLKSAAYFCAIEGIGLVHVAKYTRAALVTANIAIMFGALSLLPESYSVSVAYSLQGALALLVAYVQVKKNSPLLAGGVARKRLAISLAKPSVKITLTSIGGILIFQTGNFAVANQVGLADVIKYDALVRVGQAFLGLALTPALASIAAQSSMHASSRNEDLNSIAMFNTRHAVFCLAALAGWFAVFYPNVIGIWLGEQYVMAPLAVYLMLAMFVLEVNHVSLATSIMATGTFLWKPALISGIAVVLVAPEMAQRYGITGVIGTLFICQLVTNNWYIPFVALTRLRIPFPIYFLRVVLPSVWVFGAFGFLNFLISLSAKSLPPIVTLGLGSIATAIGVVVLGKTAYHERGF